MSRKKKKAPSSSCATAAPDASACPAIRRSQRLCHVIPSFISFFTLDSSHVVLIKSKRKKKIHSLYSLFFKSLSVMSCRGPIGPEAYFEELNCPTPEPARMVSRSLPVTVSSLPV